MSSNLQQMRYDSELFSSDSVKTHKRAQRQHIHKFPVEVACYRVSRCASPQMPLFLLAHKLSVMHVSVRRSFECPKAFDTS